MQDSMAEAAHPLTTPQRLLIAFLIGLPTTFMFAFNSLPTPVWWNPLIPILVLLVAMVLGVLLDTNVRQGKIDAARVRSSALSAALVVIAAAIAEWVLGRFGLLVFLGLAVVPLTVGTVAAFTVGGNTYEYGRLPMWCALMAWVGAMIPNIIATYFDLQAYAKTPAFLAILKKTPTASVTTILWGSIFLLVIGLVIAVLGSGLGRWLHQRLLGLPVEEAE